ncbi:hypothetical protein [Streptomyces seoulensis]|nr:hypothetical protein [Streptomyces seoulensis]
MTHARIDTVDYRDLPTDIQDTFDELMEQADEAGTNDHFLTLMARAAATIGMTLPPSGDIRRCACSCVCGLVFDAEHPDAHVIEWTGGYNLGRVQCPTCADHHRETA